MKENNNNIPIGYKQTKLGIIPEEWEIIELGDIGKVLNGLTYSPKDINDSGILVLRSSNVKDRKLAFNDNVFVNAIKYNPVKKDDILICVRNGSKNLIGKNALITENENGVAFGAFMSVFRSSINNYVFQLFDTSYYKKEIQKNLGATINSINGSDLRKFKFPLPPLPEQKAIAKILSTWDKAINNYQLLIDKYKLKKKALMQQLLKPKEDWKVVRLGDLVEINSGESPSKFIFLENGLPYYKVEQLNNSTKYQLKTRYFISEKKKIIKKGSLIFPKRGASILLNKIRILQLDCYFDTNLMSLTITSNNCNNEFLYYYIVKANLSKIADTTSIPQINNKHINPYKIFLPNLQTQTKIANILSSADKEISILEEQLAKLKEQKKGLMQVLLSGKKRVKLENN